LEKIKLKLILGGMIVLPLVLLIIPSTFFDKGQSICLSVLLLDKECFGCGMTRATQHLIHLDFQKAYYFNKLSFFIVPLLSFLYVREFFKIFRKVRN
jgi:hypothetical protein